MNIDGLILRKVTDRDKKLLFNWANGSICRTNSLTNREISWEEHDRWFKEKFHNKHCAFYIMELDGIPIGQGRIDTEHGKGTISYSLDEAYRGQGYDRLMITLLENKAVRERLCITLCADMKEENTASRHIFEEKGYKKQIRKNNIITYSKAELCYTDIKEDKIAGGSILLLTNNENAIALYKQLVSMGNPVFLYSSILSVSQLRNMKPQLVVSYNYKFIIKKEIIDEVRQYKGRIINLHTSYLPWNRGSSPNFWSFIENTPKGVTIHEIDEGLDTGNILLQKQLHFNEKKESFSSTYRKLQSEIINLFIENLELLKYGDIKGKKVAMQGSFHNINDFREFCVDFPPDWDENIYEYKNKVKSCVSAKVCSDAKSETSYNGN